MSIARVGSGSPWARGSVQMVDQGTSTTWKPGVAEIRGTRLIFLGYLALLSVEYSGLANEISALKAMRFSTVMNYALLLLIVPRIRLAEIAGSIQFRLLIGFFFLTGLGLLHADIQMNVFNSLRPMAENIMFMLLTMYVLDRRSRLDTFMLVLGTVGAVLVARNLNRLGGSTRAGALAAPYFMGDGNDFGWAMIVILPIALALVLGQRKSILRLVGLGAAVACVLGIVGTQSRGATLGLAAAAIYGWWFVAKRRVLGAVAVVVLAVGVVVVAPAGYFSRMQTVAEYEEDNSAQARLQAWGAAIRMAVDHPLGVGAGNFNSAYGRHYNDPNGRVGWGAARWISAHSIYFKVLGEYGFFGVSMLFWLIGANIRDNFISRRLLRSSQGAPVDDRWPAFLNMSIIGFAVAGAFLTGFSYPHLFLLSGLTLSIRRIVQLEYQVLSPFRRRQRVTGVCPDRSCVPSHPRSHGTAREVLSRRSVADRFDATRSSIRHGPGASREGAPRAATAELDLPLSRGA